jgi:YjbE family integral membrane protein
MNFFDPQLWIALGSIIVANILLSGDNAIVIALAARGLPPAQQKKAILFGSGAAIVLRIVLTIVAASLLQLPYLKLIGGALLVWIGLGLMQEEEDVEDHKNTHNVGMLAAIRTILVADIVMSLDNVLAVAAAANGNMVLLVVGLAISIPLIVFGSTLLLKVVERFPLLVTFGAGLLGWLAGEMIVADPAIGQWFPNLPEGAHKGAAIVGAALVVCIGYFMQYRSRAAELARSRAA